MKRIPSTELLDTDSGTPAEIAASLADLRMINRWFGGVATTLELTERVAQIDETQPHAGTGNDGGEAGVSARRARDTSVSPSALSVLEVAAGSGYVQRVAKQRLAHQGIHLELTLLDRAATHIGNGGRSVVADALTLPFGENSFDLVSSALFAHHLCPEELIRFVNESLRVCRKAVLINDLIRSPIHLALVYSGFPLYRSRLTRNDAPASVRQAYTQDEMQDILRRTNAARVEIDSYYLYRMGVIAWKS